MSSVSTLGPYLGVIASWSENLHLFPPSVTSLVNITIFLDKFSKAMTVSAGDTPMLLEYRRKASKTRPRGKRYNKEERGQLCPELVQAPTEVKGRRKKTGKRKGGGEGQRE